MADVCPRQFPACPANDASPWLIDGILEMEDVIKAYYERQGVGDLYEQQIPRK